MQKLPRANSMERINMENSYYCKIENGKIGAMTTQHNVAFAKAISIILKKNFLTILLLCLPVWILATILNVILPDKDIIIPEWVSIVSSFVIAVVMVIIGCLIIRKRYVYLEYSVDSESQDIIRKRNCAFDKLSLCSKIWNIAGYENVVYSRVNAGADRNIKKGAASISYCKLPHYIKSNYDNNSCYQLNVGGAKYIFLPDKILVVKLLSASVLSYGDIVVDVNATNFVETGTKPSDSDLVGYTWQYVNNNGTPDRRFNSNRQLPVYLYATIHISSNTGLNLYLMASNVSKATDFKKLLDGQKAFQVSTKTQESSLENKAKTKKSPKQVILSVITIMLIVVLVGSWITTVIIASNINSKGKELANFTHITNGEGGITITGYKGNATNVAIPNEINNLPVTKIQNGAFSENSTIIEVTIPNNVKTICMHAFWKCRNLTTVNLNEGLEIIQPYAFMDCINLENISIPNTVCQIGEYAFKECKKIQIVDAGIIYIDNWAIEAENYSIAEIALKSEIVGIADRAFESRSNIQFIIIPKNVKYIGEWAFCKTGLQDIDFEISSELLIIHPAAFYECSSLKSIEIPSSVTKIQSAFINCHNLETVTFAPNGKLENIGQQAFQGCNALKTVVIPNNIKTIENWVFDKCESLKTLYFQGTEKNWQEVDIRFDLRQTVYFYSENEPTTDGNYWYYNSNNEIVCW